MLGTLEEEEKKKKTLMPSLCVGGWAVKGNFCLPFFFFLKTEIIEMEQRGGLSVVNFAKFLDES